MVFTFSFLVTNEIVYSNKSCTNEADRKQVLGLKCVGWKGRELRLFDGGFIFTAAPEASFNYFRAVCNILKTTDAQDGRKRNISLFVCSTNLQTVN